MSFFFLAAGYFLAVLIVVVWASRAECTRSVHIGAWLIVTGSMCVGMLALGVEHPQGSAALGFFEHTLLAVLPFVALTFPLALTFLASQALRVRASRRWLAVSSSALVGVASSFFAFATFFVAGCVVSVMRCP